MKTGTFLKRVYLTLNKLSSYEQEDTHLNRAPNLWMLNRVESGRGVMKALLAKLFFSYSYSSSVNGIIGSLI